MVLAEKQELSRLLGIYMNDLINDDSNNRKKLIKCEKENKSRWEEDFVHGVKAQYEHARCISTKLNVEIQKELLPNWRL